VPVSAVFVAACAVAILLIVFMTALAADIRERRAGVGTARKEK